ncbi:MAG TPA: hypothetical protein VMT16_01760 [Thermoanaerobaculia bacterium]|nr:hypothetical protein [Thermoanaerobaculia bacterium]
MTATRANLLRLMALGTILAAAVGVTGCAREQEAVARLVVDTARLDLTHGRVMPVDLRWEILRPLEQRATEPLVFVHLLDAEGVVVRTYDHAFPEPWESGARVIDRLHLVHSAIAPALPPGAYRLTVGLYDGSSHRWPLVVEGPEVGRQEYVVAQVDVPALDPEGPRFTFSEGWLPVEPGTDRQTVARRWLTGDGGITVVGLEGPAQVWLVLQIPVPTPGLRLAMEDGAVEPSVRLVSDCSGFAATLSGVGFHQLTIPVGDSVAGSGAAPRQSGAADEGVDSPSPEGGAAEAAADPGPTAAGTEGEGEAAAPAGCSIRFDANYTLVDMETLRKLSVGLEQLGWQRDGGG